MQKKTIIILILAVVLGATLFMLSRAYSYRSTVGTDTELYQNTITEIGKLRTEIAGYTELIEQLEPGLTELTKRIESSEIGIAASQRGIESGLEILGGITAGSGEIGNLARELNSDITDIGAASRGLAEIFGVETEGN